MYNECVIGAIKRDIVSVWTPVTASMNGQRKERAIIGEDKLYASEKHVGMVIDSGVEFSEKTPWNCS